MNSSCSYRTEEIFCRCWELGGAWAQDFQDECFLPRNFILPKTGQQVRDWWTPASGAVLHRECLLSREDRRSRVPSLWVIATLWITKAIGFLQTSLQFGFSWRVLSGSGWLVFAPKMIPVCSATPNFSACSSFMILMSVFFSGNTHFTFWPRSIC